MRLVYSGKGRTGWETPTGERRRHIRICCPMPLRVRGTAEGKRFQFGTTVDNVGAGGICSYAPMRLFIGQRLSLLIEFAVCGTRPKSRPQLAANGVVNRVQALDDGSFQFAADFTGYRFI